VDARDLRERAEPDVAQSGSLRSRGFHRDHRRNLNDVEKPSGINTGVPDLRELISATRARLSNEELRAAM